MVESQNKKILAGFVAIVGVLLVVFAASSIYRSASARTTGTSCGADCPHEAQVLFLTELIPLLVGLGVAAGAGTFYMTAQKMVAKDELLKRNTEILLRFLSPEERLVVNRLIENQGRAYQAEISRMPQLGKVKSHRVIKRLMERGVLKKEGFGKTNMVRFTNEVREGLF